MHELDNLYAGLPIFIISTGTSLRGFDFTRLNGKITIGINRVIEYYHPSIVHFVDVNHNVDTFRITGNMTSTTKKVGRSFSDGWFGGGAGCTALHTAILLGGNPIYLLGYDYYEDNGTHFDEYDETR